MAINNHFPQAQVVSCAQTLLFLPGRSGHVGLHVCSLNLVPRQQGYAIYSYMHKIQSLKCYICVLVWWGCWFTCTQIKYLRNWPHSQAWVGNKPQYLPCKWAWEEELFRSTFQSSNAIGQYIIFYIYIYINLFWRPWTVQEKCEI